MMLFSVTRATRHVDLKKQPFLLLSLDLPRTRRAWSMAAKTVQRRRTRGPKKNLALNKQAVCAKRRGEGAGPSGGRRLRTLAAGCWRTELVFTPEVDES